jgi:hypothetical protein
MTLKRCPKPTLKRHQKSMLTRPINGTKIDIKRDVLTQNDIKIATINDVKKRRNSKVDKATLLKTTQTLSDLPPMQRCIKVIDLFGDKIESITSNFVEGFADVLVPTL